MDWSWLSESVRWWHVIGWIVALIVLKLLAKL